MVGTVHRYGNTTIEVRNGWLEVTLPDGSRCQAVPHTGADDVARAKALGYDNVWDMTKDHDRYHALLAEVIGLEESPVLRAAVNKTPTNELIGAEEAAVLALQRYVNLCLAEGLLQWRP